MKYLFKGNGRNWLAATLLLVIVLSVTYTFCLLLSNRVHKPSKQIVAPLNATDVRLVVRDQDTNEPVVPWIERLPFVDSKSWWQQFRVDAGDATIRIRAELSHPVSIIIAGEYHEPKEVELEPGQQGDVLIRLTRATDARGSRGEVNTGHRTD